MTEIEIYLAPLSFPEPPPIVVSDESFLIGRDIQMFRAWKDARLKRLSREHARIEINGLSASLCDLGSTNGTKINNVSLTAREPRSIRDGDIISFANVFKYEVKIVRSKAASDPAITQVTADHIRDGRIVKNKTLFIASADSYLDMLCEEDDPNEGAGNQFTSGKNSHRWIVIAAVGILAVAGGLAFYLGYF